MSAEQLSRMEDNRRKAQAKLSSKRAATQVCTLPAKKPAYSFFDCQSQAHHSAAKGVAPEGSKSASHFVSPTDAHHAGSRVQPPPGGRSKGRARGAEARKPVKVTLTLVSRTRFKAVVSYDQLLIEVFKKVSSKAYDAKTCTWSFGIEDHDHLAKQIIKQCPHTEVSPVPKQLVSHFLMNPTPQHTPMNWDQIPSQLTVALMPFQKEGVEFGIRHNGRVLIADDMGLGKTIQAITIMCYYKSDWPLLIVCPSSVKLAWAEALVQWVPWLTHDHVNVVSCTKDSATRGLVNVISYDLLSRLSAEVQAKQFKAVIADECHFLKSTKTARTKASLPILKAAARAVLLSGTPALSRPIELYTQISAVSKHLKMSFFEFGQRYCNGVKNKFGWDFSGASNMQELQVFLEDCIMIRRLKSDVMEQLPSKRRQMVLLDLGKDKKTAEWKQMKEELNRAAELKSHKKTEALLPLFSRTGVIKVPGILDYIMDLLEGGRKLLVFAHHKAVLDAITESLGAKGYQFVRIDGRTPSDVRQQCCDQFQHDEECRVAVLSITAANSGITLTASSTVVFAELFWNPGILVQAEDRAHRIGQKDAVNIHYLVARETADDFIWPLVQSKLEILSKAGLAKSDFLKTQSICDVSNDLSFDDAADLSSLLETTEAGTEATSEQMCGCLPGTAASTGAQDVTAAVADDTDTTKWFEEISENDLKQLDEF